MEEILKNKLNDIRILLNMIFGFLILFFFILSINMIISFDKIQKDIEQLHNELQIQENNK